MHPILHLKRVKDRKNRSSEDDEKNDDNSHKYCAKQDENQPATHKNIVDKEYNNER